MNEEIDEKTPLGTRDLFGTKKGGNRTMRMKSEVSEKAYAQPSISKEDIPMTLYSAQVQGLLSGSRH